MKFKMDYRWTQVLFAIVKLVSQFLCSSLFTLLSLGQKKWRACSIRNVNWKMKYSVYVHRKTD